MTAQLGRTCKKVGFLTPRPELQWHDKKPNTSITSKWESNRPFEIIWMNSEPLAVTCKDRESCKWFVFSLSRRSWLFLGAQNSHWIISEDHWKILEEIIGRYRIASWVNYWSWPTLLHSNAFGYVKFQGCHRAFRQIQTVGDYIYRHQEDQGSRHHALLFPTGTTARGAAAGKEGLPKFQIGNVGMNHYDILWRYHLYAHNQGRLHLPLGFKRGWVECVSTFLLHWILGRFQTDADLCEWTHRVALVCDGTRLDYIRLD